MVVRSYKQVRVRQYRRVGQALQAGGARHDKRWGQAGEAGTTSGWIGTTNR